MGEARSYPTEKDYRGSIALIITITYALCIVLLTVLGVTNNIESIMFDRVKDLIQSAFATAFGLVVGYYLATKR